MKVLFSSVTLLAVVLAQNKTNDSVCPISCDDGWDEFQSYDDVLGCNLPMVLLPHDNVDLMNGTFSACMSGNSTLVLASPVRNGIGAKQTTECTTGSEVPGLTFKMSWRLSSSPLGNEVIVGAKVVQNFFSVNCQEITSFYRNGNVIVAGFSGQMVQNQGAAKTIMQDFIDEISKNGASYNKEVNYCPGDPAKTVGILANTAGNMAGVQEYIKSWSSGDEVTGVTGTTLLSNRSLKFVSWPGKSGNAGHDPNLGICKYIIVDASLNLANRCGVTDDALALYNPKLNMNNLQSGQPVCCTVGDLPDLRPKPNADGSCYVHQVLPGSGCNAILAKYYPLTESEVNSYNKQTYGWRGCNELGENQAICVSSGTPPKPTPVPGTQCGPLAPGDLYNSTCPLNACCSKDGFCGLSADHCAKIDSPTGAPGTNGCYSNCNIDYVKGNPPAEFINVGYYESWSIGWQCMNRGIHGVDWSNYTHVHFSFAGVDVNVNVVMDEMAASEFELFRSMTGFKKVVSFGGWGISTDPSTYQYLRNAMIPSNVGNFVTRLVKFVADNGLDGLDIDWEYPGAIDIPGIPPGLASDAPNYLNFLRKLRASLPKDKSLSIAAPASYWYLQAFPIAEMSQYLDYIVYMTYDLHGQWDYGNKWTSPGCEEGNCLRSHVNKTETQLALNLITHAGVPSNKILLGLGAYGRSFKQQDPNCSGPNCKFTGPESGATPGKCTNTAGYISLAEINEIVESGEYRSYGYDRVSDSAVMTYGTNQWVSWTTEVTMNGRVNWAKSINLGGAVTWAADLRDWKSYLDERDLQYYMFEYQDSIEWAICEENRDIQDLLLFDLEDEGEIDWLQCRNISKPVDDSMCRYVGICSALRNMVRRNLDIYKVIKGRDYQQVFIDYYQPGIFSQIEDKYMQWMLGDCKIVSNPSELKVSNVTTLNQKVCLPDVDVWQRYIECSEVNVDPKDDTLTIRTGCKFKDEQAFYKDFKENVGIAVSSDSFEFGPAFAGCYDFTSCNFEEFDFYPFMIMDKVIPNPMANITENLDAIENILKALDSYVDDYEGYEKDVIVSTLIPALAFVNGVEAIVESFSIGIKLKEIEERAKKNAIINFILGIVFMILSFVPGGQIIGEVGSLISAGIMDGDVSDPMFWLGALGGVGEIFTAFRNGAKISSISEKVVDYSKISTNMGIRNIGEMFAAGSKSRRRLEKVTGKCPL